MVDSGYSDDDVVVIESRETLSVMGGGEKPKISSSSYSYNSIWTDVKPFVHGGLAGLPRKSLQACFVLPFLPVLYHSKDPKIAAQVKKHIPSKQAYNAIFKNGATPELLPSDLSEQVNYFKTVYPTDQHTSKLPTFLLFMAKYKVPWIFKWRYHIQSDILTRQMLVKWWDTYKHQRIIDQVKQEFPVNTIATPIRAIHPSPPEVSTIRLGSPSPSIIGTSKSKTSKSKSTKLLELAQQLIAQASQASDSSSEESVTSKSPYDSLFQDAQDPFA